MLLHSRVLLSMRRMLILPHWGISFIQTLRGQICPADTWQSFSRPTPPEWGALPHVESLLGHTKIFFQNKTYICAHVHITDTLASNKATNPPKPKRIAERRRCTSSVNTGRQSVWLSAHMRFLFLWTEWLKWASRRCQASRLVLQLLFWSESPWRRLWCCEKSVQSRQVRSVKS